MAGDTPGDDAAEAAEEPTEEPVSGSPPWQKEVPHHLMLVFDCRSRSCTPSTRRSSVQASA